MLNPIVFGIAYVPVCHLSVISKDEIIQNYAFAFFKAFNWSLFKS
jgi:hypothetical protein